MLKKQPLYPIFFSFFSVLALAAYNIRQIALSTIWRPLMLSIILGGLVYAIVYLLVRNWHTAALIALSILAFIFSYGQVYAALERVAFGGVLVFRHRTLIPLYVLLILFVAVGAGHKAWKVEKGVYWLNLLSLYLLVYPVFVIVSTTVQQSMAYRAALTMQGSSEEQISLSDRDVYYIILDAYGREDILSDQLGYDNRNFINALQDRGFYIADCSQSNYAYTEFSMPSSLNYDYLDTLDALDENRRLAILKYGAARSFLEENGYQTVAFSTGWDMTEWKDADVYLEFERTYSDFSEFEKLALDTTLFRVVSDFDMVDLNIASDNNRRMRTLSALKNLKQVPARDGNFFVFGHIVVPHSPYSFGPNGEWIEFQGTTYKEMEMAYLDQITFINREILQVIDILLAKSEMPPVIVIQGDHGPPYPEISTTPDLKMPILNAYYLPGVDSERWLYSSISPVNTFRVILNAYFGQSLPLLEDQSYYSPDDDRYNFEFFPNSCSGEPIQ